MMELEQVYINREQSWLEFNERVLEESQDKTNPLMERLKFLAISASNLDEFYMVRVPPILHGERDVTGQTPASQLAAINKRVTAMMAKQYNTFNRSLLPAMEKEGINLLTYQQLDKKQRAYVDTYFHEVLYQILTPMAIDQSRPFPTLNNRTVNLFIELEIDGDAVPVRSVEWDDEDGRWRIVEERQGGGPHYAVVQVPTVVPRIFPLPGFHRYIMLEEIIMAHIERLFLGYEVTRTALIRVTRSSDFTIDEEETDDLLLELARSIRDRRWGDPVRIEIANAKKGLSMAAKQLLTKALGLTPEKIFEINGPLDLTAWMYFASDPEFAHLRNTPLLAKPAPDFPADKSMFEIIRKRDVLVHHPYMSFDCVVRFVQEAAEDSRVLAIKQTLYRVSGQSPIIAALVKAAENGKQVTVLLEIKARFDEENNINWARVLERAGVHVVYGLIGLKTHCKACLVVRREDDGIRRYMHLSTGNYNDSTAKLYTDTGFFTCRETFGQDASVLFNVLTGFSKTMEWQKFAVAPATLRSAFLRLIDDEISHAQNGSPAEITAKMNSFTDVEMVQALCRASQAGVKVNLLVRGMCCLQTGIAGVSDNITVSSVVDRYLEHSRIYAFGSQERRRVFLSSADWMPRNLDRRVEVLFPIEDPILQDELITQMEISLADNVKRRELQPDGTYRKPGRRGKSAFQSQLEHHRRTVEQYKLATEGE